MTIRTSTGVVLITGASSGLGVADQMRFIADTETGVAAMVKAIEQRRVKAHVPASPWLPLGTAMKVLPLHIARRLT